MSGVGPHSWQKDRHTYRQKHRETEGPTDLERHRCSQRHHTHLPSLIGPFPVFGQGPAPPPAHTTSSKGHQVDW